MLSINHLMFIVLVSCKLLFASKFECVDVVGNCPGLLPFLPPWSPILPLPLLALPPPSFANRRNERSDLHSRPSLSSLPVALLQPLKHCMTYRSM